MANLKKDNKDYANDLLSGNSLETEFQCLSQGLSRGRRNKMRRQLFALLITVMFLVSIPLLEWKIENHERSFTAVVTAKNQTRKGNSIITVLEPDGSETEIFNGGTLFFRDRSKVQLFNSITVGEKYKFTVIGYTFIFPGENLYSVEKIE